jgi:hypothetical protein
MKTNHLARGLTCLCVLSFLFVGNLYSQLCPNGRERGKETYDISFIGDGNSTNNLSFPQYDTSKLYFSFNFPQFDMFKGTLVQVDIETIINVENSYEIENLVNVGVTRTPKIRRSDFISSPVLGVPLERSQSKIIGTHLLGPADGTTGSGPDYVKAGPIDTYKDYPINYSLTSNLAGFLGKGQVEFNYLAETDLSPSGSNTAFVATTKDSVYFRLTYYYCLTSLLPADISSFTAIKLTSEKLQLAWTTVNDEVGKKYEIEKSTDGQNFTSIQTLIAKSNLGSNYQVNYTAVKEDKNQVFFRIKQTEADGTLKYSSIKSIPLDYVSTMMKVYPTVTHDNVKIYFPFAPKADYQVSVTSITGQVIQHSQFMRTNLIQLPLKGNMKPGLYIVSVTNKQTAEVQQSKIILQ